MTSGSRTWVPGGHPAALEHACKLRPERGGRVRRKGGRRKRGAGRRRGHTHTREGWMNPRGNRRPACHSTLPRPGWPFDGRSCAVSQSLRPATPPTGHRHSHRPSEPALLKFPADSPPAPHSDQAISGNGAGRDPFVRSLHLSGLPVREESRPLWALQLPRGRPVPGHEARARGLVGGARHPVHAQHLPGRPAARRRRDAP